MNCIELNFRFYIGNNLQISNEKKYPPQKFNPMVPNGKLLLIVIIVIVIVIVYCYTKSLMLRFSIITLIIITVDYIYGSLLAAYMYGVSNNKYCPNILTVPTK